jgi:Putative Ig domain
MPRLRTTRIIVLTLSGSGLLGFMLGCGGKSSSGPTNPPSPAPPTLSAPSNLSYAQPTLLATVGTAIAPDLPTVTGTVTGYSVTPALPTGLSLDPTAGTISGTPSAAAAQANYIVTASNTSGNAKATLQISVAAIPPPSNLVYPQTMIDATVGTAIAPDTPTVTGTVAQYSISPALPAGLRLDTQAGTVSGTPTASAAQASYTITASNTTGNTTAQLTITVNSAGTVLLEQGHGSLILAARMSGDHVLSEDLSGHWVLWVYSTGDLLAQGDGASTADKNQIELAGQLAAISTSQGVQVYSTQDGHLIFTVPPPSWWRLAQDGSYVCAGTASALTVWSATGQTEFALNGNYSAAVAFAAPGQVQVAAGPAGSSVIETDTVPAGTSRLSPKFSGNFYAWFLDGNRFLTTLGTAVWVYSNSGTQQALVTLPSITQLTGQGNWLWTVTNNAALQVYAIGSSTPTQTFTIDLLSNYFASGNTIGVLPMAPTHLSIIDLSGASPSRADFSLPSIAYLSAFAANSSSQWVAGNKHGVLLDGASLSTSLRYFGYGEVNSIVAASSEAIVSTAVGKLLLYDLSIPRQVGSTDLFAGKLALSSDGSVLAAAAPNSDAQFVTDRSLNIYSLPSMNTMNSFPYTFNDSGTPFLVDFSLSSSGGTLGQVLVSLPGSGDFLTREVTGISGSPTVWTDSGNSTPIDLSPDGTLIAVGNVLPPSAGSNLTTNIFKNGSLVAAVSGYGEAWIDNGRLLVANYVQNGKEPTVFAGSTIYDATGATLASIPPTLPPISNPLFPTSVSVYDANTNAIYSLTSGLATWQGPIPQNVNPKLGAVAGSAVVYESGHQVIVSATN